MFEKFEFLYYICQWLIDIVFRCVCACFMGKKPQACKIFKILYNMRQNIGHELVAKEVIEQVKRGEMPNMSKAAESQGYAINQSHRIAKAATFQKALFELMPHEWIALKTRVQADACYIKEYDLNPEVQEEDLEALADEKGWRILASHRDEKTNRIQLTLVVPNHDIIDKTLDKIFKLGGLYAAEKMEISTPLDELTDQELREQLVEEGQIIDVPVDKPQTPDSSNFAQ